MSKRMRCFGVNHNAIEKKTNQLIVKFVSSIEVDGNGYNNGETEVLLDTYVDTLTSNLRKSGTRGNS